MAMRFDEPLAGEAEARVESAADIVSADLTCEISSVAPEIFDNDQFISFSDEYLSDSECLLDVFSEFERDKITDRELVKKIPKLDLSEVEKTWGTEVRKKT